MMMAFHLQGAIDAENQRYFIYADISFERIAVPDAIDDVGVFFLGLISR